MIVININNIANKVRSTVLTGLNTGLSGVITATDTVLEAFGKLQNQLNDKVNKSGDTITGNLTLNADVRLNAGIANRLLKTNANKDIDYVNAITANRALVSDANGMPTASSVTDVELRDNIVYTYDASITYTQGQRFEWKSPFGDYRIYRVLTGHTLNAGETPFTNPEKVELINNNWLSSFEIYRWHPAAIRWNFPRVLSFDNGAANAGSYATPILGNGQTITEISIRVQTPQAPGSIGRLSLYEFNSLTSVFNSAYSATLIHDGGTITTDGGQGIRTVIIPPTILRKGKLYFGVFTNQLNTGSFQRMSFDLSFLGFDVTATSITRYVMFAARTTSGGSITNASVPAQTNILVAPSNVLPCVFVR